jgi:sugar phosphate isomerase/epimerase
VAGTRRAFLNSSLATAAAIPGASLWSGAAQQPAATVRERDSIRVSVLAYSFHGLLREGKMDIFGFLETCKHRYRLQAADLWSGFLISTDEDYLKKVKDGLEERDMVVPNLGVDGAHVWTDDAGERKKNYERALAHLKAGSMLGARFVRIDAGGDRKGREWTGEQFDHIVKRYREYAQYAQDHGFRAGAESHWGPEAYWPSMQKLCKAVNHPGFAICCHISGWQGTQEEKDLADRESAPWVAHTHIAWNITEGPLVEKMTNLRNAGYMGFYSIEHHTGRDEYAEVAIQLAKVRAVLQSWRTGGSGAPSATPRAPGSAGGVKP